MHATCRACQRIYQVPVAGMVIGETEQEAYARFFARLMKHLEKHHPEQIQLAQKLGGELAGLVLTSAFLSNDPRYLAQQEEVRARIHAATAPPPVSQMVENTSLQSGNQCTE